MARYRRRLQWRDTGVHRGVYNHLQLSTIAYSYLHISTQVGAVLVLTLVILVVTKLCLTGGRWSKAPPATPPTPRLTQVDSRHYSRY